MAIPENHHACLNNKLVLVWYSDVHYSNSNLVFRPSFENLYPDGGQMVV